MLKSGSHNLFDVLAPFYESYWGQAFLDHSISLFRRKLAPQLTKGDHVVELCCGTGYFAQWLAKQGYWVSGIDGSRNMLTYARKRLRSDRLFHADIRNFHLGRRVNAVVCFYNSLNQFLEPDSFRAVLATSFRNLNPGGWFLFDFIQEHGYAQFWETDEVFVHGDTICELRYRFDSPQQLASCTVTIGPLDKAVEHRAQVFLRQRPYSLSFVAEALHSTGFELVVAKPVSEGNPPEGRSVILARRPSKPLSTRSWFGNICQPLSEAKSTV